MTEREPEEPMTPMALFFCKTATVLGAILIVLTLCTWYVGSAVEDLLATPGLKGGHVFWAMVQKKIIQEADSDDLAPAEKEKIVKALGKISLKYRPYLEALFPEVAPPAAKHLADGAK